MRPSEKGLRTLNSLMTKMKSILQKDDGNAKDNNLKVKKDDGNANASTTT